MALIKIIMKRTEVQIKLNLRWEDYRLPQQVLLIFQLANKTVGIFKFRNYCKFSDDLWVGADHIRYKKSNTV